MIKNGIIMFAIIIVSIASCKNKSTKDSKTKDLISINDFDNIAVQELPYSFAFEKDSVLDYFYTLEAFESTGKIVKNAKLNSYFSDSTTFLNDEELMIMESKNYPYIGDGYFYTRLPNINDIKVLIFTYQNTEEAETLPYFELQTFDENNKVVDKLILAGGINYDCSWDRQFAIDTDYKITVIDNESCFDPEDEKRVLTKTIETQYRIGNDGLIEKLVKESV